MVPSKDDTPQSLPRLPPALFMREELSLGDLFRDETDRLHDSTLSNESVCEVIDEVLDILDEAENDAGDESNGEDRRSGQ
jgi:hypothetical protein